MKIGSISIEIKLPKIKISIAHIPYKSKLAICRTCRGVGSIWMKLREGGQKRRIKCTKCNGKGMRWEEW